MSSQSAIVWSKNNPEASKRINKKYRTNLKLKCYEAYGGSICKCCGESESSMLSLDHINNDGYKHRKELGIRGGEALYRWIIKNNFPSIFQILCMNCQFGRKHNRGICPHNK